MSASDGSLGRPNQDPLPARKTAYVVNMVRLRGSHRPPPGTLSSGIQLHGRIARAVKARLLIDA
jgi:ABC-type ATPase involved in cell division